MTPTVRVVTSSANPLLKQLRRLARDGSAYRDTGRVLLEGEHLCGALLEHGLQPDEAVVARSAWAQEAVHSLASRAPRVTVVDDIAIRDLSGLESPGGLLFVFVVPAQAGVLPQATTVVLDRLQDAGNVGTIIRTAAALGVKQVIALKGTAALWSPKVLRAGMGAHFGMHLVDGVEPDMLSQLQVPLLATSSHAHSALHAVHLPYPCAWVFGHEGQGIAASVRERCTLQLRIPQPGGEESLNVAGAAAICLYESLRQREAASALR